LLLFFFYPIKLFIYLIIFNKIDFIDNNNMDSIPKNLQFNHGIPFINQIITLNKIKNNIDHGINDVNNNENKGICSLNYYP